MFFWARADLLPLTQLCPVCTIDYIMSKLHIRTERRSLRLWISIPVRASSKNAEGKVFSEDTETVVVNAHGGLFFLHESVKVHANIVLTNLATKEEQACRVVTLGDSSDRGIRVGIEFLSPSPGFWGVEFPPDDWHAD
jgi:hypothetical protein